MQETMKCGVYYGIGDVKVEEKPVPKIQDDGALVKILRAGICGSDTGGYLHGGLAYGIYEGFAFGHEMIGEIVELGKDVTDLQVGDIVFVDPTKAKKAGQVMADVCGAFTEYVDVEGAKKDYNIYVLKKDIDRDFAALIEPLSVGTQGALAANPQPNDNVVVLGAGTIGLCAAAGLINHGIKNVVVCDRNDWKLQIAKDLGCKVINTKTEDMNDKLVEYFGAVQSNSMNPAYFNDQMKAFFAKMMSAPGILDRVAKPKPNVQVYVDCAGAKDLLLKSLQMCGDKTKYSIVTVYHEALPVDGSMFMSEPVIMGSAGYSQAVIKEVIDHVENKRTCINKIITNKFGISEFPRAIEEAAKKEYHNIKVVIDYENK